jgi:signal transduction histidine kinase
VERWLVTSDPDCSAFAGMLRQIPDVILGFQVRADGTERISLIGIAANYVGSAPRGPGPAGLSLPPEELARWLDAQARHRTDGDAWCFEGRYLTLTGAARRFECHILPRQADGTRHGLVLDTTQRKAAEAAERQVKEARAELIALKQMASVGQLTAGIVHEIKNPLNFISNFAAVSVDLLDELGDHLAVDDRGQIEEVSQLLAANLTKIRDHAGRVDSIIRSMLLHAYAGSGVRRPSDLNQVVEEARTLAFHGARAMDMSFSCSCVTRFDPTIGMVDIVPEDMTRVMVNLVSNAFYATEKRRHELHPGYAPEVVVSTGCCEGGVEIRVEDNGVGIPPAVHDRLFTPFFTTKPAGEGTGLGLSLSADIVQEHGGRIRFENTADGRTAFIIFLPLPPRRLFDQRSLDAAITFRAN